MDIGNELPEIHSKLKKDICILIFTYDNHNHKLITILKKLNEIDIYKIISFNYKDKLPFKTVYDLSDVVVTTHETVRNVNHPWFWHMKNGSAIAKEAGFKYAFMMCGDTYIGKPERIFELPELLGDNDVMSYAYHLPDAIGTFVWFSRVSALVKISEWLNTNWDKYYRKQAGFKLTKAISDNNLKFKLYNNLKKYSFYRVKGNSEKGFLIDYLDIKHLYGSVKP